MLSCLIAGVSLTATVPSSKDGERPMWSTLSLTQRLSFLASSIYTTYCCQPHPWVFRKTKWNTLCISGPADRKNLGLPSSHCTEEILLWFHIKSSNTYGASVMHQSTMHLSREALSHHFGGSLGLGEGCWPPWASWPLCELRPSRKAEDSELISALPLRWLCHGPAWFSRSSLLIWWKVLG